MSVELELDNIDARRGIPGTFLGNMPVKLDQLQDCEPQAIRKTLGVRNAYLEVPVGAGAPLVNRTSLGSPISETAAEWIPIVEDRLEQVRAITEMPEMPPKGFEFPHLAWEALKFGLAKENHINEQLNYHISEIEKDQQIISLLLDLNGEIGESEEKKELSDKALDILEKLKQKGINFKEGLTNEELKRQSSSKESDLRSKMQITFTTKVQRMMQHIESIHQILQNIIRSDAKVKEKANQLQK